MGVGVGGIQMRNVREGQKRKPSPTCHCSFHILTFFTLCSVVLMAASVVVWSCPKLCRNSCPSNFVLYFSTIFDRETTTRNAFHLSTQKKKRRGKNKGKNGKEYEYEECDGRPFFPISHAPLLLSLKRLLSICWHLFINSLSFSSTEHFPGHMKR